MNKSPFRSQIPDTYNLLTGKLFPPPTSTRAFDYSFTLVNLLGKLYSPILDYEWLDDGGARPHWPNDKSFAVCLTHDVDVLSAYSLHQNMRRAKNILKTWSQQKSKQNLILLTESLEASLRGFLKGEDPFNQFEKWLELEAQYNAHSTFFFTPEITGEPHFTDCWYRYSDTLRFEGKKITGANLIREIHSRGMEIGLHPSWNASTNIDIMRDQKQQLEEVLGEPIYSVRQHWLRFDNFLTPAVQSAAGFRFDSSVGLNDNVGFRRGTSYPFPLMDLKNDQKLPLWEMPLIIQDGAMFHHRKGMRLNHTMALEYITTLAGRVRETGGVLTVLWHPDTISQPVYWDTYRKTLAILDDMGGWFGSVREVGEWWQKENGIDLVEFTRQNTQKLTL